MTDLSGASPLLRVQDVAKTFGTGQEALAALRPVAFDVAEGEFVCLLGPSGSGKSTLLRIVGGLLAPDLPPHPAAGNGSSKPKAEMDAEAPGVYLRNRFVDGPQPDIGFVFQRTNLMPWRTALQNVLLPLHVQGSHMHPDATHRAQALLRLMGLDGFEDTYPHRLSGGMAQRVALARALFQNPALLLLDEPFGALDALTRERLNIELAHIHESQNKTMLMVTHSIQEAVLLADRVLILGQRPGRIIAEVAIDLPRPRTLEMMGAPPFGKLTLAVRRAVESDPI